MDQALPISRRTFLKLMAGVILSSALDAGLTACSGTSKQEEDGRLMIYTPARGDLAEHWAKAFTEDTGIQVDQVIAGTNEVLGKIRAEKDNPHSDVWIKAGGLIPFMVAKKEGLLRPYQPPGWENIPLTQGNLLLRDADWHWVGAMVLGLGYAYNPSVLSETEIPQTWEDLTDDRWKGQIEIWDPAMSGTSSLFLLASLQRYGEKAGWEYLRAFYNNLQSYTNSGSAAFRVAKSEVQIGLHFQYQVIQYLNQLEADGMENAGENLRFFMPPDSPVVVDPVGQINEAPNPTLGERFENYILSKPGQELLRENGLVPLSGLKLELADDVDGMPVGGWYSSADFADRAQELDFDWMSDNMEATLDRWKTDVEQAGL